MNCFFDAREALARRRRLWCFHSLAAAFLLCLPMAGLSDYLRVVGPAPLRFEAIPVRPPGSATLAAIAPPAAPEVSAATTHVAEGPVESPPATPPAPIVATARSPEAFGTNDTELFPWTSPPDASFTAPEMVLPFFQKGLGRTNGVEAGVMGSVMFIPPVPAHRPPPSKAVYSTPSTGHEVTDEKKE